MTNYKENTPNTPINGKSVEAIECKLGTLGMKIDKDTCFLDEKATNKEFAHLKLEIYNIKNCLYTLCRGEASLLSNKKLDIPINIGIIPEQGHNSVREFYNQLKNYALVADIHDEDMINRFFMRGLNKRLQLVAFAESFAQKHMPLDEWVTKLAEVEKICQLLSQDTS
jgi:hypothetical protein